MDDFSVADRHSLAELTGLHEQYLYQCMTGRRQMAPDRCPAIERATDGRVTVEELRPDLAGRWYRIPDPAWPHPKGRPLLDVAAPGKEARDAA
jgi:hypothetical protein